jgi:hypothetical protein
MVFAVVVGGIVGADGRSRRRTRRRTKGGEGGRRGRGPRGVLFVGASLRREGSLFWACFGVEVRGKRWRWSLLLCTAFEAGLFACNNCCELPLSELAACLCEGGRVGKATDLACDACRR